VVIIAAAGNENRNAPTQHAIPTLWRAALDAAGEKAPYSNFGAGVDISALVAVQQVRFCKKPLTRNREAVFWLPSTSMAAPHVAGVAALVKAEGRSQMKFSVS